MKKILSFTMLLMCVLTLGAQQISVNAPQQVGVGEQFRLSYTINTQDVQEFRGGNVPDGLEVLIGPNRSAQSSYVMVNGHTTSSSSITFTYIVYANEPGTYTISGARAKVGGKTINSSSVKIKVSGQPQSSQQQNSMSQQHPGAQVREAGSRISGNDLFIKVTSNKKRVHEQEPILLTYKVYTQVELTQLEGKMPDLKGFHTQEINPNQQKSFHIENVNGRPYRCVTWNQYVMYPQMTGKLEIPSITYKGIVVQENRSVDPFEAFLNGGSGYVEVKKDIIADGLTIQVDPLPEKPQGFSGGVGHFTISGQLLKNNVKANDPVTLRIVVSGNGNLKLLKQPEVSWPTDFERYDAKVTDKTQLTTNGLEGNIIYDFLAVPRNKGEYDIPEVKFIYYDTHENSYKTIKTSSFHLVVNEGSTIKGNSDFDEDKLQDINGLKFGDRATLQKDNVFGTSGYIATISGIFLLFVMLIFIFRRRAIERADIVKMRGKKANKVANSRLKKAAKLMRQQHQDAFYDEVLRALWGYVGDKLNIPAVELSRDNITDRLTEKNINMQTISTFLDAIDECEYARYAPGEVEGKMNTVYDKAVKGITDIDNTLKHMNKKSNTNLLMVIIIIMLSMHCNICFADVNFNVDNNTKEINPVLVTKSYADSLYTKGLYSEAAKYYNELIKKTPSAELYYNLGNTYYRLDNLAQSILAYERAIKLSPSDRQMIENIRFVRTKTIDKMQRESNIFIVSWWYSITNLFNPSTWAIISIVSLVLVVVFLLVFLFMDKVYMRQIGFFGGIALFILFILSNIFAWQQTSMMNSHNHAIIITPACSVKNTPDVKSSNECEIHEATHVKIIDDNVKGWYEVLLDDGKSGWIESSCTEII